MATDKDLFAEKADNLKPTATDSAAVEIYTLAIDMASESLYGQLTDWANVAQKHFDPHTPNHWEQVKKKTGVYLPDDAAADRAAFEFCRDTETPQDIIAGFNAVKAAVDNSATAEEVQAEIRKLGAALQSAVGVRTKLVPGSSLERVYDLSLAMERTDIKTRLIFGGDDRDLDQQRFERFLERVGGNMARAAGLATEISRRGLVLKDEHGPFSIDLKSYTGPVDTAWLKASPEALVNPGFTFGKTPEIYEIKPGWQNKIVLESPELAKASSADTAALEKLLDVVGGIEPAAFDWAAIAKAHFDTRNPKHWLAMAGASVTAFIGGEAAVQKACYQFCCNTDPKALVLRSTEALEAYLNTTPADEQTPHELADHLGRIATALPESMGGGHPIYDAIKWTFADLRENHPGVSAMCSYAVLAEKPEAQKIKLLGAGVDYVVPGKEPAEMPEQNPASLGHRDIFLKNKGV